MPTQTEWLVFALGVFGAVLIASYVPVVVRAAGGSKPIASMGCSSCANKVSIITTVDNIPGIDLNALNICRQKGLM